MDRDGVAWVAIASGHLAHFDQRKVKAPLNGRAVTGPHAFTRRTCYPEPLPLIKGRWSKECRSRLLHLVDYFDTLGWGRNVPINSGNASEGLLALKNGKWVILRVPYPLGFYMKWIDGFDDANAS